MGMARSGVEKPEVDGSEVDRQNLELAKLRLEIVKLRADSWWLTRILSVVLPLAAAVVGWAQFEQTGQQRRTDATRLANEDELKGLETHLKQVETSLRLNEFAFAQRTVFLSPDPTEQARAVKLVKGLLVPPERDSLLRALCNVTSSAEVLTELNSTELCEPARLVTSPAAVSTPEPTRPEPPPARPPPVMTLPAVQPVPRPTGQPLRVFYHIAQEQDRSVAVRMAAAVPSAAFPSAGVELVRRSGGETVSAEVRYYKTAQKAQAEMLAAKLTQAAEDVGKPVAFSARYIGDWYPNLPDGRAEVWFPALSGG